MAGMVHQLIDILQAELDNYNKLLELSVQKIEVIVKNNVDELKNITSKEDSLIGNNQNMERKRDILMNDISIVLNKDKNTLTLSNLIDLLNNQEQTRLKEIHTELKETLNKLKESNTQNGALINQALEYVDFNINVIQSSKTLPLVSYQNGGLEKQFEGRNFFDKKQ